MINADEFDQAPVVAHVGTISLQTIETATEYDQTAYLDQADTHPPDEQLQKDHAEPIFAQE